MLAATALMVVMATPAATPSPSPSASAPASVSVDYIESRDALLETGVLVAAFAGAFLVAVKV